MYNNSIYINYLVEYFAVILETEFQEIIESLPEFDYEDISWPATKDKNNFTLELMDNIIWNKFHIHPLIENLDFENKTFDLYKVESLEELNKIKDLFNKWEINNYEDLIEEVIDIEKQNQHGEDYFEKIDLLREIIDNIPLAEIQSLYDKFKK